MIVEDLPDGVFLDLPEDVYFAQNRLGSSDIIKLHLQREGWFWSSRHNPDRKDDDTDAKTYGSALHALLLEGVAAYEHRFAIEPDPADYPGLLTTIPQIKAALIEAGCNLRGTSDYRLADWLDAATIHIPSRPCWATIQADFEATLTRADGTVRRSISAVDDRMLRFMLEAALEDDECRQLLGYGEDVPTLAEVSVLWTDELGLRRRARLDKPVPRFTMDLKSVGNWQGRSLQHSLDKRIKDSGYDIQRADYHTARRQMHGMIATDDAMLHGGSLEHRAWAQAIAQRDLEFYWLWLFYQKPEPSGRAPLIFPVIDYNKSRYHISGHRKAYRAARFYQECVDRFGLGEIPPAGGGVSRPWSSVAPVHYTDQSYDPHLTIDMFGFDDAAVPDEEDAMT